MKPLAEEAEAMLDPELRALVEELTPEQRIAAGEKFARWVDQLTNSVALTRPDLVMLKPPPEVPRGFFLIKLAKWQQVDLPSLHMNVARICAAR